jgi:hypothetical protein
MVKDDSATNAKRIYKYSVAFPYVVGTVAGFQLVFFLGLEIL